MTDFTFVTSNDLKVRTATQVCADFDITFDRAVIDFIELQSLEGEPIARHKAEQAYEQLQKPVVITDDSWIIPGLNGFPGPYMKQVNDWFNVDDWLRLTRDLTDRRIILRQIIVYQDDQGQQLFSSDLAGSLLSEPRGRSNVKHFSLISFDGKHSAAEVDVRGESVIKHLANSWHDLCTWLRKS